jgi:hypothetical protein
MVNWDEVQPDEVCLICGKNQTEAKLVLRGHGRGEPMCESDCDPRYDHPQQRHYAELTTEVLDDLEFRADAWDADLFGVEVKGSVLHSLVQLARHKLKKKRDLPTPCDLLVARDWIQSGAPAYPLKRFGERLEPKAAIDILNQLIEGLPSYIDMYCYGTKEYREAMIECQQDPDSEG